MHSPTHSVVGRDGSEVDDVVRGGGDGGGDGRGDVSVVRADGPFESGCLGHHFGKAAKMLRVDV